MAKAVVLAAQSALARQRLRWTPLFPDFRTGWTIA
jgi:hypothetical protein